METIAVISHIYTWKFGEHHGKRHQGTKAGAACLQLTWPLLPDMTCHKLRQQHGKSAERLSASQTRG